MRNKGQARHAVTLPVGIEAEHPAVLGAHHEVARVILQGRHDAVGKPRIGPEIPLHAVRLHFQNPTVGKFPEPALPTGQQEIQPARQWLWLEQQFKYGRRQIGLQAE